MASFRIALIGAGEISSSSHLPAILGCRETELACLIDPVEVRAKALCREYGLDVPTFPQICLALGSIARAEMPPIDGAIIATPNHTHEAIAIECLENRISVLVEKPLACSLAEGERIISAAERNQTVIAVGYCTRFRRNVQLVGEALRTAYFGQVRGFAYHFGTRGGWSPVTGYFPGDQGAKGGVLTVSGSHFLDRMLSWFGYPFEIEYADDSLGGPEANAVARFRYPGFSGTARLSKTAQLRSGCVIETEQGFILLPENEMPAVVVPHTSTRLRLHLADSGPACPKTMFQLQVEDFVQACRAGRAPVITGRAGCESLRLLDALYRVRTPLRQAELDADRYSVGTAA